MKRRSYKSASTVQLSSRELVSPTSPALNWSIQPELSSSGNCQADTWVELLELPNSLSHNEALLLCQHSEDKWVAWVPNHGEAVLHTSQFCFPAKGC